MKILLVTQWFEPEPTFKGLLFAKELQKNGHEVEVITGFPNYPGGIVYPGYRISIYKKEIIDGVVVHRVPLYPSHNKSAIKRILNYVSFAVSSFLAGLIKTRDVDVIYSYHPPLTTSLSAVFIGLFKKVPVVVDIQDLWPDTLSATGMLKNKIVLSIVGKVCDFVYASAAKIVVLSPGFKSRIELRGVPGNNIDVIYNWCHEHSLNNSEESEIKLPSNGNLNLLFAGNLGFAQGLPSVIMAAESLAHRGANVNIVMLGDGVAKAQAVADANDKNLNNVFFLPRVPMAQVGSLLSSADMLLVHLIDDELFRITIPSRTQANLAMSKPIVMGVAGDAAELINRAKAGVVCLPENVESLVSGIEKIASMTEHDRIEMGRRGCEFYYRELSLEQGVKKFINIFESVTQ